MMYRYSSTIVLILLHVPKYAVRRSLYTVLRFILLPYVVYFTLLEFRDIHLLFVKTTRKKADENDLLDSYSVNMEENGDKADLRSFWRSRPLLWQIVSRFAAHM